MLTYRRLYAFYSSDAFRNRLPSTEINRRYGDHRLLDCSYYVISQDRQYLNRVAFQIRALLALA